MTKETELIERIDELAAKATPGEWTHHGPTCCTSLDYQDGVIAQFMTNTTSMGDATGHAPPREEAQANKMLTAALVNAWPSIKAELERLTRELAEEKAAREKADRQLAALANWHCESDGCAANSEFVEEIGNEFAKKLYTRAESAESRLKAAEGVVGELVDLKDLKTALEDDDETSVATLIQRDGPLWHSKFENRKADYERRKPLAWQAARDWLHPDPSAEVGMGGQTTGRES